MSRTYDDSKYGVIERQWFSLPITWGGDAAAGITFNETEATKVKRFYPKGPIKLLKFGALVMGTLGKGEEHFVLSKNGTRVTTVCCSTSAGTGTISSTVLTTSVTAGQYLSVLASTNACSTGTVTLFVDYIRKYSSKWDD